MKNRLGYSMKVLENIGEITLWMKMEIKQDGKCSMIQTNYRSSSSNCVALFLSRLPGISNFAIWKKYHICAVREKKKCQSFLYCYDHASGIEFNGWRI